MEIVKDYSFDLKEKWLLRSGDTATFKYVPAIATTIAVEQRTIAEITYPEVIRSIVGSSSMSSLLVLVHFHREGGGFDYSYLGIIKQDRAGNWMFEKALQSRSEPMKARRAWISELGAVSNDGTVCLVKAAERSSERAPYTIKYEWQTWNLDNEKLLGSGLDKALP